MADLPAKEELLRKIEELEAGHASLKRQMSSLILSGRSQSVSPRRRSVDGFHSSASFSHANGGAVENAGGGGYNLTDRQYLNILQSMGQAVHILDCNYRIIYWNRTAEKLYGYTAAEAIGQNAIELLTDVQDYGTASKIIDRVTKGESWTGVFPVKNKAGRRFHILATDTPFYDVDGRLVGLTCVSCDSQPIREVIEGQAIASNQLEGDSSTFPRLTNTAAVRLGLDPQQPLQDAITSQISNLATKISLKGSNKDRSNTADDIGLHVEGGIGHRHLSDRFSEEVSTSDHREDATSSGANTPRGDASASSSGLFNQVETNENRIGKFFQYPHDGCQEESAIPKNMASNENKGLSCPWRVTDSGGGHLHLNSSRIHKDEATGLVTQRNSRPTARHEFQIGDSQHPLNIEASGSALSSFNMNSTSSVGNAGSTSSCNLNKMDFENDCLDYEILWEDLTIGEQIGQGSCGTVYHALWYGSDVAVKVFSRQDYSEDIILSFRQEISLMKRLRHPNVLLFMGAVASPDRLCIVTEYLPRGSLFSLLQKNASKLDWRKRIQMALDIARGMNYLHHFNPPIIHRDLKSSNLLVDRNWTLKVGDFGLSRLKNETYLTTRAGKGTPQWMAPEVIRNEPSDEASDIYSYGVVLWEIVTQKIPWENYNSIQVISAVGYMNRRLEIPNYVDSQWASIIESCWHSDPHYRPTFPELLERLKDLQKQYIVRIQSAARSGTGNTIQKKCNTD